MNSLILVGEGATLLVGGLSARNENDPIQLHFFPGLFRDCKVPLVNRIECSAEESYTSGEVHMEMIAVVCSGAGAPFDFNLAQNLVLPDNKLVEFHQFQEGEKGHDHFRLR